MSKEAVKYVETLYVSYFVTKSVLLAIARNTSNKSCKCDCGIKALGDEIGLSERTVSRHLAMLKERNIAIVKRRPNADLGSLFSDIELVGFRGWLQDQVRGKKSPKKRGTLPDTCGVYPTCQPVRTIHDIYSKHNTSCILSNHVSDHGTTHVKHDSDHGIYHDRGHVSSHDRVNVTNMKVTWGEEGSSGKPAPTTRAHPNDPVTEADWQSLEDVLTAAYDFDDYFAEPARKFISKTRGGSGDA